MADTHSISPTEELQEQWRDIPGYEGVYQVSSCGHVRRLAGAFAKQTHLIKPRLKNSGYLFVTLNRNNQRQNRYVHELVALLFVGPRPSKHDINHVDGDKFNNVYSNLEYATRAENMAHARALGLHNNRADGHYNAKLTSEAVREIRWAHNTCGELEALPDAYGVSRQTILDVLSFRSWGDVK